MNKKLDSLISDLDKIRTYLNKLINDEELIDGLNKISSYNYAKKLENTINTFLALHRDIVMELSIATEVDTEAILKHITIINSDILLLTRKRDIYTLRMYIDILKLQVEVMRYVGA